MKSAGPRHTLDFSLFMEDAETLNPASSDKSSDSGGIDANQKKVKQVTPHPIELILDQAAAAINQEYFDTLVDMYTEDAILVIQPGMNAVGKMQIRKAFQEIATRFEHTLTVKQAGVEILETEDTALVVAKTLVSAKGLPVAERQTTYVFKKDAGNTWFCVIDNSYGKGLLE